MACAVGRLSVRVFGMEEDAGLALAHHLGRALQLTNILRDLDEDATIGRLYLPREALNDAGITTSDPLRVLSDPAIDKACLMVATRARQDFAQAETIMERSPRRIVRTPRIMAAAYRMMLKRMMARGWRAPRAPVRLGRHQLRLDSSALRDRVMPRAVHIIGAGLAGLSAAVRIAPMGIRVTVYEATNQAGGRCRSYHDPILDMTVDNGNHLLLSGNRAALSYLETIGARDRVAGPARAEFPFVDLATGERWTLRPNDGRLPWWVFARHRRVPGTRPLDYLALLPLLWAGADKTIGDVLDCEGPLYERLIDPFFLAVLNTEPPKASAALAWAVLRELLAAGGRNYRPLIAQGASPVHSSNLHCDSSRRMEERSPLADGCARLPSTTIASRRWISATFRYRWRRKMRSFLPSHRRSRPRLFLN